MPARAGTWHAILQIERLRDGSPSVSAEGESEGETEIEAEGTTRGIRYSFSVHSFTNIRMKAHLSQNHLEPGATLAISARLTEYGLPVSHRAKVHADLEQPDGNRVTRTLSETEPGQFQATATATVPGV
ncbi:hypothetical protein FALCPG4_015322 [Fusarium falciforme]